MDIRTSKYIVREPKMASASMCNVEIRKDIPHKGKGLFSTRDIKKGEILFEESPLVSCQFSWNQLYKYKACDHCMASMETAQHMAAKLSDNSNLVLPHPECCGVKEEEHCRCDKCGVQYCSSDCHKRANEQYHQALCLAQNANDPEHPIARLQDTWRNIHFPPETCSIMLLARMAATVAQSSTKEVILSQFREFCKATIDEEQHIAHKLLGKQFQDQIEMLRLMCAECFYSEDIQEWLSPEGFRSIIALLGTNGQGIGTSSLSVWVHNCDDLDLSSEDREKLDGVIDKLYDDLDRVSGQFLNCEGSGLYSLQSACNHSCSPNAEVTFPHNNHVLAVKTLQDIMQGEEICISYLDDCQLGRSRHSRQKILGENYIFTCMCAKCELQAQDADVTSEEDEDSDNMDDS